MLRDAPRRDRPGGAAARRGVLPLGARLVFDAVDHREVDVRVGVKVLHAALPRVALALGRAVLAHEGNGRERPLPPRHHLGEGRRLVVAHPVLDHLRVAKGHELKVHDVSHPGGLEHHPHHLCRHLLARGALALHVEPHLHLPLLLRLVAPRRGRRRRRRGHQRGRGGVDRGGRRLALQPLKAALLGVHALGCCCRGTRSSLVRCRGGTAAPPCGRPPPAVPAGGLTRAIPLGGVLGGGRGWGRGGEAGGAVLLLNLCGGNRL
mmetsp:Transcript_33315/g.84138  ORF Transcript_33315/g.84138 Transcript_33315/m.84138 type:complete len:263 (-) Transcript_33315:526-1314(-)